MPIEKVTEQDGQSANIIDENIEQIKALFPDAFTEGADGEPKVDFAVLRQLLGDASVLEEGEEKYGLNWHGKKQARQIALTPSTGTLLPCPEESVDWDTTQNLFIEGDNLEVLKLLQKSYAGKVKAIYIDPPYNTGRNIIYKNDFTDPIQSYLEMTGQKEGENRLSSNPEVHGRFHSSWLSMIYPRLKLAKNLLSNDGILFCTIDENEHDNLSVVIKEIFGAGVYEHAYITIVHNPRGQQGKNISYVHENAIVVYRADQKKHLADVLKDEIDSRNLRDSGTDSDRTNARNCFYPFIVKEGKIVSVGDVPADDFHPESSNVKRSDGSIEIWPLTDSGDEKKWRYANESVVKILPKLEPKMGRSSMQMIFHKDAGTMRSVWQNAKYDSSEYGTKLIENLIEGAGFTFPKSIWAVYDALRVMTEDDPNAICMDFFAGSGTTAHATWKLNKDLGGNRKFILVQLPEPLDESNKEQKGAVKFLQSKSRELNIAEITKERLRAAAIQEGQDTEDGSHDFGFKVLKLHNSNINVWNPDRTDLEATLLSHKDHLVEGRSEQDVLYELLLKRGIELTVPIEEKKVAGKTIYSIGYGVLFACLDTSIAKGDVDAVAGAIAEWHKELEPETDSHVFFRDSAFADDIAKTNMAAILEQNGIAHVRSL